MIQRWRWTIVLIKCEFDNCIGIFLCFFCWSNNTKKISTLTRRLVFVLTFMWYLGYEMEKRDTIVSLFLSLSLCSLYLSWNKLSQCAFVFMHLSLWETWMKMVESNRNRQLKLIHLDKKNQRAIEERKGKSTHTGIERKIFEMWIKEILTLRCVCGSNVCKLFFYWGETQH